MTHRAFVGYIHYGNFITLTHVGDGLRFVRLKKANKELCCLFMRGKPGEVQFLTEKPDLCQRKGVQRFNGQISPSFTSMPI